MTHGIKTGNPDLIQDNIGKMHIVAEKVAKLRAHALKLAIDKKEVVKYSEVIHAWESVAHAARGALLTQILQRRQRVEAVLGTAITEATWRVLASEILEASFAGMQAPGAFDAAFAG